MNSLQRLLATSAALLGLAIFSAPFTARAGPSECRDAVDDYNSAVDDVSSALRYYANCVSGSEGQDDCSSEFYRLSSAQDDFESAVSDYQSDCS